MNDQRRRALRTVLHLISNLLWVAGLSVGLSGVLLLLRFKQSSFFFSHVYIIVPGVLALSGAVLLVVCGCLGSCQSTGNAPFLQGLFVYLLVVVFCLESTASALAYFHATKINSELAPFSEVLQKYTGSSQDPNSQAVDITQKQLRCCGVHDYRDWLNTLWFNSTGGLYLPHSCCNSSFPSCKASVQKPWELNSQGCMVKLEEAVQLVLSLIFWCFPGILLIEIVLFVTVGQLMTDLPTEHRLERKVLLS